MDTYTFPVSLKLKGGKYWASCEAFPGAVGIGDSEEEAKASICAVIKLYVEDCLAEDRPVPYASTRQKATISIAV